MSRHELQAADSATIDLNDVRDRLVRAVDAGLAGTARLQAAVLWRLSPTLATAGFLSKTLITAPITSSWPRRRVYILRSFTVEPIVPALVAEGLAAGVRLDVTLGDFNAYAQEALDPASRLYAESYDCIILAVQSRDIAPDLWLGRGAQGRADESVVERVGSELATTINAIRARSSAAIVVHGLDVAPTISDGIADSQFAGGQVNAVREINRRLTQLATEVPALSVLDYERLVARHGQSLWYDDRLWASMRIPLANTSFIPLAHEWFRFVCATGASLAKVLVCDLDNTLWGGVIGEDGMDGIVLGEDEECCPFLRTQRAILDLYHRGIILAICSKNNHDDAVAVFEQHTRMLLRLEHFAALRINWDDKPANLMAIADEISVGRETLVFLDDNPIEREHVAQALPEVQVLDLPPNADEFARVIRAFPPFERLRLTTEDRERGAMYAQQRQRSELQVNATSVEDYYRSLEMKIRIEAICPKTVARASQLTQKTNQFNMTTRRYTEADIAAFQGSPTHLVRVVYVADRFGDNGAVGLMIVERSELEWRIDTLLMSCRVIGRTVETAMLAWLSDQARAAGAKRLVGEFIATKKNAPAAGVFASHGFEPADCSAETQRWTIDVARSAPKFPAWIALLDSEVCEK